MSKLRVYMVAKELGIENKSLVSLLQSLGVRDVRNHMSAVAPEQIERVKRHLSKPGDDDSSSESRLRPSGGVIIRRARKKEDEPKPEPEAKATPPIRRENKPVPVAPRAQVAPPAPPPARAEAPAAVEARVSDVQVKAPESSAASPGSDERRTEPETPPEVAAIALEPQPVGIQAAALPAEVPAAVAKPPAATEPVVVSEPDTQPLPRPAPEPEPAPEPAAAAAYSAEPEVAPASSLPMTRRTGEPVPVMDAPRDSQPPGASASVRPKTGIDVWQGRPGVPMPQPPRSAITPRRVQYDAKAGAGPGAPRGRGPTGAPASRLGGRAAPRRGIGSLSPSRKGGPPVTQERNAHKKVVKIEGMVSLQNLAAKMQIKAGELLMKLLGLGMTGVNINSTLDPDTAKIVGGEFGWTVEDVAVSEDDAIAAAQDFTEEDEDRVPRPPVVTVMGHVDHGKTSLLDTLRKASVAGGEAGGITQHIGAYSVKTEKGRITFLDTPGHAAFTAMRARGAKATDIVVLVVAADDGVMPQTKEAIAHARDGKCPIVVAVNKVDKPEAQPDRVRRELSENGLVPEEWGGDTLFCEVSAKTGQGLPELLDNILLQAEVLDLRANPKRSARGMVIEAKLDRGRGPLATVLVQEGTLRKGDGVIVGTAFGRVRAMLDDAGRNVAEAGPSMPVAVVGLNEVPSAGDTVDAVKDAKKAQEIADQRRAKAAEQNRGSKATMSLEDWAKGIGTDQQELKLIVKADVHGSAEALRQALEELTTDKVRVNVVHSAVGAVTEGDVNLAVAAKAVIIGFNVRPAGKARMHAQKEGIEIRHHIIIYEVLDAVRDTMQGMLAPTLVEEAIGKAEVRKIFKVTKGGVVAGCMVINGVVRRNSMIRLQRASDVIWEGKLDSLKRFKDDAKEVREGLDCGIAFSGYTDLQEGDVLAAFEMKEVRPTL